MSSREVRIRYLGGGHISAGGLVLGAHASPPASSSNLQSVFIGVRDRHLAAEDACAPRTRPPAETWPPLKARIASIAHSLLLPLAVSPSRPITHSPFADLAILLYNHRHR